MQLKGCISIVREGLELCNCFIAVRQFASQESQRRTAFVSSASIWEIATKLRIGKLEADPNALVAAIGDSGFTELPVSAAHAARVSGIAIHHTDPFDRLLIAQALYEPLHLLTADKVLAQYSELVILV